MNKDFYDMFGAPVPDIGTEDSPSLCYLCDEFGVFAGFAPGHGAVNFCPSHFLEWDRLGRPQLWGYLDHVLSKREEQRYYDEKHRAAESIAKMLFTSIEGISIRWANHLAWVFIEATLWTRRDGEYPIDSMHDDLLSLAKRIGPEAVKGAAEEAIAEEKRHTEAYREQTKKNEDDAKMLGSSNGRARRRARGRSV